jgi:pyruvate/2-oxoglutarate/acetoin dehydrogenase E1 component
MALGSGLVFKMRYEDVVNKIEEDSNSKLNYKQEVIRAMEMLGEDERVIFIGQTVKYKGSAILGSLGGVPQEKRLEMPIMEDSQMGISIGLSLEGYIPVSVYPRFDFLICAINQLVNHLDKTREMSNNQFKPKVIIRTQIGGTSPLYPGVQHCSDYTSALKEMLKEVNVVKLERAEDIFPAYKQALESDKSTLFIEVGDLYNQEVKKEDLYPGKN